MKEVRKAKKQKRFYKRTQRKSNLYSCYNRIKERRITPEEKARIEIDKMLEQAGWVVQDRSELNIRASIGVAIREFVMKDNGESDYLLFVNGKAIGVLEAKKAELSLSGVENQSQGYACNLPEGVRCYQIPLPFVYESNGSEILL